MASSPRKFESVPLLDLNRQYSGIRNEILAAIERVCDSQAFILGPEVEALEREIATLTTTSAAVACASGTDALWLALAAAGIGKDDYVVTTPFSFLASSSAIVRAGARPLFADVDPATLNLDANAVLTLLRNQKRKVGAIVPVHLYGQCADMDALQSIADDFKLLIIEDAAQAMGASWNGRPAGSMGVAAAFSFYPTKNLSAAGDAGLATTMQRDLAEDMRRLRNHGSAQRYVHQELGWNARMDAIQAAVLRVKLPHLEAWNLRRRELAAHYARLLGASGLVPAAIAPLDCAPQAHHVYHQYVVRAQRRDDLRQFLKGRNIGTEIYYPIPLHLQPCFEYLGYKERSMPEAERAAREVLALPMFPELTEDEQKWVVQSVADFYS